MNPYDFKFTSVIPKETTKVRESSSKPVHSMEFILLFAYRLSFPTLASLAYVTFFFFNSLHTARILAVVAGTMAIFDLFLTLILSVYYNEKQ